MKNLLAIINNHINDYRRDAEVTNSDTTWRIVDNLGMLANRLNDAVDNKTAEFDIDYTEDSAASWNRITIRTTENPETLIEQYIARSSDRSDLNEDCQDAKCLNISPIDLVNIFAENTIFSF